MKKNYFKPETELVDVRIDGYILNDSSGGTATPGGTTVGGGADPDEEAGVNRGRGEWGNVWGGGGSN